MSRRSLFAWLFGPISLLILAGFVHSFTQDRHVWYSEEVLRVQKHNNLARQESHTIDLRFFSASATFIRVDVPCGNSADKAMRIDIDICILHGETRITKSELCP